MYIEINGRSSALYRFWLRNFGFIHLKRRKKFKKINLIKIIHDI